ncbi:MAG: glycosyltransferase family 2 protein [Lachnospiraceae bacterium]|nr:glycosyltransferase family 2 protein [Lachnospiraceae bacterium]
MCEEKYGLVSVIMPAYNCEKYIGESIDSVLNQTYAFLELIIVNDASTDDTKKIILEYCKKDNRIFMYDLHTNSGAAAARNKAIEMAKGKFIAFLDSDDIWKRNKLEKQIEFMEKNHYPITCTSYGKIDSDSKVLGKIAKCKNVYTYKDILIECPGNSTIIYDVSILGKTYGPDLKRRNDFALLLLTIKKIPGNFKMYGLSGIYGYHRIRTDSISKNKWRLVSYQWYTYRRVAKLSIIKSLRLVIIKIVQTINDKNG